MHSGFKNIIGQKSVKETLSVYIDAYGKTGRLPFLNFSAARGAGKTHIARTFRENLKRPDGTRPPLLEINAATIPSVQAFFEQVYPTWVQHKAFLFLDEAHNLAGALEEIFLTALNVEKNPIRTVVFQEIPYEFDFRKIAVAFSTTDKQKLGSAFANRLRDISFRAYSEGELYKIFKLHLDNKIFICPKMEETITCSFRGDPRDTVKKGEDLLFYCESKDNFNVDAGLWEAFEKAMGINPYGLEHAEIQVLRAIGERVTASLTSISAATDFSRGVIQYIYEPMLTKKKLMIIDGKRSLTNEGLRLFHKIKA